MKYYHAKMIENKDRMSVVDIKYQIRERFFSFKKKSVKENEAILKFRLFFSK